MRLSLLGLIFCLMVPLASAQEPEGTRRYLMTYFVGNGEDGLHLCHSTDGLTWEPLNGGESLLVPTVGTHKLMRDPSIVRGPDGTFHMVWTISWTQRGIGYASSKDLIHWTPQKPVVVMEDDPTTRNCWAPELFYDEPSETYYIFWSSTVPGKFGEGTSEDNYNHRQYYITTKDFKTFSKTQLFFDPGHNVIDGFMAKEGDQYLLLYKDETLRPEKKTINLAIGKTPVGPFEPQGEIGHTNWIEGPTALKIGDWWYVYYDCYRINRYGGVRSKDLKTWENVTDQLSFPKDIRHGTTFEVDAGIVAGLKTTSEIEKMKEIAAEAERILVTDFGAEPGSRKNTFPAVEAAIHACRAKSDSGAVPVSLVFPRGQYHFFNPEGRDRTFGIWVDGMKNFTIEGEGSEFIFHGTMGICSINNSENVTVQNFTVDWEKPYIVQGNIVDTTDDYVDIRFDTNEYPYEITEGNLLFIGEDWKRKIDGYTLLFDKDTKEMVYQTRDGAIGHADFFNRNPEDRGDGIIRFHGRPGYKAEPGTYIALWLGRYILVGFDLRLSKDVTLENIDLYHALSHGVAAFKTENVTLRSVNYKTNDEKDRVFTMVADGYHLNTCKGLVKIENCSQVGMGDDFLNLHGMNVMIEERVDDTTVAVKTTDRGSASYVLGVGDEVWFIDGTTMQRGPTNRIKEIKDIRDGSRLRARHIIFEEKIPETIKAKDALENKTWNAELEMRDCQILRRHRARGILVTTPKRVVIENNYFRTAGTAILIEGDVNYWYESGACEDLLIRNNVFEDCFSSGYAGDWGHAVITIHPSFRPQSEEDEAYHRNIRIENNTFKTFDYPLLFARSVRQLRFADNTIERTKSYEPFAVNKATFWLDGCREVLIENNTFGEDVLGKNVKTLHMKSTDLVLKDNLVLD